MENNVMHIQPSPPSAVTTVQEAEKIINIGSVEAYHQHLTQVFIPTGLPGTPGYRLNPVNFSRDYYNLIICGKDPMLSDGTLTMPKDICLVEEDNIAPALKECFSPLSAEALEQLKSYPCILAGENRHPGWTDEDQPAAVAQLLDIRNHSNGIDLTFHLIFAFPQCRISELLEELGICGKKGTFNELNHSHWSVKQVDLLQVLTAHGLNPYASPSP